MKKIKDIFKKLGVSTVLSIAVFSNTLTTYAINTETVDFLEDFEDIIWLYEEDGHLDFDAFNRYWKGYTLYYSKNNPNCLNKIDLKEIALEITTNLIENYPSSGINIGENCRLYNFPKIDDNEITCYVSIDINIGTSELKSYSTSIVPVIFPYYALDTLPDEANVVTLDIVQNSTATQKEHRILSTFDNYINNTNLYYGTQAYRDGKSSKPLTSYECVSLKSINKVKKNEYQVVVEDGYNGRRQRVYNVKLNEVDFYLGDMDGNGVINGNDASIVLDKYNKNNATASDVARGDMDGNGVLNGTDASMILDLYNKGN